VIHAESGDADLVLLGLATPDVGAEEEYAERLREIAEGLESFFFVRNATLFIGSLVSADEEEGPQRVPLPDPPKPAEPAESA
jgi:hypothetical protein